ncbi:SDR family oxidoreductase [Candidatus Pelagibacter sp.]|nr:SDR family oxidoreductase [Candidatus Pelagibacter sp.]
MKKIFITGGAGYVGCRLVKDLLEKNFFVTVYDAMHYTDQYLPKINNNLKIIEGDIRNTEKLKEFSKNHDVFVHLACISNDASFVLDENLSKTVNFDCFEPMVKVAKENKIRRFIYASSSSVYGVSDKKDVKEDHPLLPLTAYNKYKGLCEPILLKYADENFETVIFRPATVCGYSPRMRFDLSVNILTCHAIYNNKIKVFGGEQLRPNLHIQDYSDCVQLLISENKDKIQKQVFNVGFQNLSIMNIAKLVKKELEKNFRFENIEIVKTESNDNRSYHINSDKIYNMLGFKPKFSIEDAVQEITKCFKKNLFDNPLENSIYHNVKTLKKNNVK